MIRLTLAEIAAAVAGRVQAADPHAVVSGQVQIDSRAVAVGDLFVALPGSRVDGHDFAATAAQAGAVATLAERPVDTAAVLVDSTMVALSALAQHVRSRLSAAWVIGVTGSSGKTSTKDLLAAVLADAGPTHATPGSYNNEVGLPLTVLQAAPDTRFLVLEMGARGPGHIAHLCRIAHPEVAVVLNVGSAHLGEFGDLAGTARAKAELVQALPPHGLAVLNADDPAVARMAEHTGARVVTFGRGAAQVRADQVQLDQEARAGFRLITPLGDAQVRLAVHGEHQVHNAVAVAAVALAAGMLPDQIAAALGRAGPRSAGRMRVLHRSDGVIVIDDTYNANPESVAAALHALAAVAGPVQPPAGASVRRTAVLGSMLELGADSVAEHRRIGRLAAQLGIAVVAVGEAAPALAAGATEASGSADVTAVPDVPGAVAAVRAQPGDVVLVKASRSVGLERVVQQLMRSGEQHTEVARP